MKRVLVPLALLACLGGCTGMPPHARDLLMDAYAAWNSNEPERAKDKSTQFIAQYGSAPHATEAYMIRAMANFALNDTEAAEYDAEKVLDRTTQTPLRARALMLLGEIAYRQERWDIAAGRYDSALKEIPRGQSPAEQAHWRLGQILMRKGDFRAADIHFAHLVELFPDSREAAEARQYLGAKAWSVHAGVYETPEAADAAAKRLQGQKLPAFAQPYLQEGKLVYAVLVGRFADLSTAKLMLEQVKPVEPEAFLTVDKSQGR